MFEALLHLFGQVSAHQIEHVELTALESAGNLDQYPIMLGSVFEGRARTDQDRRGFVDAELIQIEFKRRRRRWTVTGPQMRQPHERLTIVELCVLRLEIS